MLSDYFSEEELKQRPSETHEQWYERLNIRLPDGRRLLGPPDPPRPKNKPREFGGSEPWSHGARTARQSPN